MADSKQIPRKLWGSFPLAVKQAGLHLCLAAKSYSPSDFVCARRPQFTPQSCRSLSAGEDEICRYYQAYIVLRPGKWDIPAYFGDGSILNMHLAYLMLGVPFGVPFTLDQAYPFVRYATVAFGFPDILFEPEDGFVQIVGPALRNFVRHHFGPFSRQPSE